MRIERDQWRAILTGAAMLALFGAVVLAPLRYQRAQHERRIAAAEQALGIDLKEAQGLARLNDEVVELRRVVRGAQQYVPRQDEMADVVRGLSEALDAYGLVERDLITQNTQHFADYSVIPIQLRFQASYPSAHGVLQRIERMRRLIRVDEMRVRGHPDNALAPLSVEMNLSTFIANTDLDDTE